MEYELTSMEQSASGLHSEAVSPSDRISLILPDFVGLVVVVHDGFRTLCYFNSAEFDKPDEEGDASDDCTGLRCEAASQRRSKSTIQTKIHQDAE
jgi:hypothetical protein